jgi:hypothetical protein
MRRPTTAPRDFPVIVSRIRNPGRGPALSQAKPLRWQVVLPERADTRDERPDTMLNCYSAGPGAKNERNCGHIEGGARQSSR